MDNFNFSFKFSGFLWIFKKKYNLRWKYSWFVFDFFAGDLIVFETRGFIYVWFEFE